MQDSLPSSPLSPTAKFNLLKSYQADELAAKWMSQFGIDITPEITSFKELNKLQCCESGLVFYSPASFYGNGEFYAELGRTKWYYPAWRWEYGFSKKICMRPNLRVLEVGCGSGKFLENLPKSVVSTGLELNPDAEKIGKQIGVDIRVETIENFSRSHSSTFDIVFAFQVLEHIPHPITFIKSCLKVLKTGGLLVFATPNSKSFIKDVDWMLLDMPPHHSTGWSQQAFRYLEKIFPVTLLKTVYEPLDLTHINFFIKAKAFFYRKNNKLTRFLFLKPLIYIYKKILFYGGRHFVRGQGMLAVFEKNP
jgi:SAM-dependent methyltransferase